MEKREGNKRSGKEWKGEMKEEGKWGMGGERGDREGR